VGEVVEHSLRIAAPPATVFAYFTDPARMTRWMGTSATLDPRPGGACRIEVVEGATMVGEFVAVEPYSRVVVRWGWEQERAGVPPCSTLVEVRLAPDGDGTLLRLTHRRLPAGAVAFHRAGWAHFLPRLAEVA
jgi:uncharacterized protein YndB with AHSA1/START domain